MIQSQPQNQKGSDCCITALPGSMEAQGIIIPELSGSKLLYHFFLFLSVFFFFSAFFAEHTTLRFGWSQHPTCLIPCLFCLLFLFYMRLSGQITKLC